VTKWQVGERITLPTHEKDHLWKRRNQGTFTCEM